MFRQTLSIVVLIGCVLPVAGCSKTAPPKFRFNAVEWLKQERTHLPDDEHFDSAYKTEIGNILTAMFGTPDQPEFPFLLGDEDPALEIISLENLKLAAGPVPSDRSSRTSGLYREHCARCHGITGDGAGPTAVSLDPYPRDFRLGKFKYKSTPLRQPPTDQDLLKTLRNGIPGTAMPSFGTLPDKELVALIQYVKYLTLRGQFERFMLAEIASLDGAPLIDLSRIRKTENGNGSIGDDVEEFKNQMYELIGEGLQQRIIGRWLDPEQKITEIPPAPLEFDIHHQGHRQLVSYGQTLFSSKANCQQCHGVTGVGDGINTSFDDWTNEWIKSTNYDPNDSQTYQDFLDVGALPPRVIKPRNLRIPVYRGGDHPDDLYLRLANGIEGTPMPASTALDSDEIWALVAYVRSLPYQDSNEPKPPLSVDEREPTR